MTVEEKEEILENKKKKKSRELIIKHKIPTGFDLLDIAMEGGWDVGGIAQVFADSKAHKSEMAVEIIYNAMLQYGGKKTKYRYNDAECGLSFDTAARYSYPLINTEHHVQIPIIESVKADILNFCETVDPTKDEVGVYIVDSQDWLYSLGDQERTEKQRKEFTKSGEASNIGTYGDRAKKLGELWREITKPCYDHNVHIFIISQIRDNMNASMFGPKHKVSGGHASKFGSSKRFSMKKVCDVGPDDRPYGSRIRVTLDKTRTRFEGRSVYVNTMRDTGFDNTTTNLLFLFDLLDEKGKEIPSKCEALKWEETYNPSADIKTESISSDDYKAFAEELDILNKISEEYGSKRVSNIKKYISANSDVMNAFANKFGVMSLKDMVSYIENNDLEKELTRRVKLKWDYLEEKDKPKDRKERPRIDL